MIIVCVFEQNYFENNINMVFLLTIVKYILSLSLMKVLFLKNTMVHDAVAQCIARLTRDRWIPVSREFEPYQRHPLFP